MKSFAIVAVLLCLAAAVRSDAYSGGAAAAAAPAAGGYGGAAAAPAAGGYGGGASAGGYGGGASAGGYGGGASAGSYGGGASIPAPPCPKNYLFSCQPSLQPAPCSQPAASYGSAGAYSENYPIYALQVPQYVNGYQTY